MLGRTPVALPLILVHTKANFQTDFQNHLQSQTDYQMIRSLITPIPALPSLLTGNNLMMTTLLPMSMPSAQVY